MMKHSSGPAAALLACVFTWTGCTGHANQQAGSESAPDDAMLMSSCPSGTVEIPSGTYLMGSEDGDMDERPTHHVTVSAFCMDRTEVTVAMYEECVRLAQCPPAPTTADWPGIGEAEKEIDSQFCTGAGGVGGDHPINCVDWSRADTYCRSVGKRLPTEEEWEYAARGTDGRKYPWGNAEPSANLLNATGEEFVALGASLGRFDWKTMYSGSDGWGSTAPVGSYPEGASPFGVLDMAGNVWEFTSSWYAPDYNSEPTNDRHVTRGGGWGYEDPSYQRTSNRGKASLTYRGADIGFRCAADLAAAE